MHTLLTALAVDRDLGRRPGTHDQHLVEIERTHRSGRRSARRLAALALTRLSLASADAVRALDACVADDLSGRLQAARGL